MNRTFWSFLLSLDLILMTMLVLVFPLLEPGTATHTIALITGSLQVVILIGVVLIVRFDWNPL